MQEIITYIIVVGAILYVVYSAVRLFFKSSEKEGGCGSCNCEAKKAFVKDKRR